MSKSGFCWADEVEKEEEESRIHIHEPKKPNPFGSARPREVVLQEKGIDWRKLDQKLHQQHAIPRKEENHSEPLECLNNQDEETDFSDVPPLRYPPKNIMSLLKQNQWPNIVSEAHPNLSKMQKQLKPNYRDVEWEKENHVLANGGRFMDEELGETRKFRSSSVCGERERGNMIIENEYRRGNGVRERARRSPSVSASVERIGYHHAWNVGVRPLEECENMEFMYGRQRFDPRKLERPHSGRVDGWRAQAHQDLGMGGGGFGFNKRRGIELGLINNRDHQRRRN